MNIDQKILYLAVILDEICDKCLLAASSVDKTYYDDVSDYSLLFRDVGVNFLFKSEDWLEILGDPRTWKCL